MMTRAAPADAFPWEENGTLARLRLGGPDEVAMFLASIRPSLRKMLDRGLSAQLKSRFDASDIVQETLVRVSSGLNDYLDDPRVPPGVWVRIIGKRVAAEMHRNNFRSKRDPSREVDWDSVCGELMVNRIADSMQLVWRSVSRKETRELVRETIDRLPPTDREILEMRHVEGYEVREIAEALMVSHEAAKKRYQRALSRFRDLADGNGLEGTGTTP